MAEIRSLVLHAPPGDWLAVDLREAADREGPWTTIQAKGVDGDEVTVTFRPRVERGYYRALWGAPGGTRGGLADGPVLRLAEDDDGSDEPFTYGGGR